MKEKTTSSTPGHTGRAIVIGGSIAGLTSGLALMRSGWDVQIFEATRGELEQRGAGIITHQALFDVFKQLDIASAREIGVSIQTRKAFSKSGEVIETIELPQIASSWGRMYQLLRRHFPDQRYHQNKVLAHCLQREQTIEARFTDGSRVSADLLIAADGIRSTIRNQLEPTAQPQYVGYVAWRGLIDEQDLSRQEQTEIFPYFTFCLPEGEQVLTYPVAGSQHQLEAGKRRCNVVWYRPASDVMLQDLLTDINGDNNGESIAPDKVRREIIDRMRRDSASLLSPQHAALVQRLDRPFIQPIYDLTTTKMIHGRTVIIGDAAFTARPHLGAGITKAAEDGIALANQLQGGANIDDALMRFERERYEAGSTCVNQSRALGAYLQAQLLSDKERRFAEQHRTTAAVLRETAVLSA